MTYRNTLAVAGAISAVLSVVGPLQVAAQNDSSRQTMAEAEQSPSTQAEYDQMFNKTKNWGRWGANDQLGTMNLITDKKRREAASLVHSGISVSVSHPAIKESAADVASPFEHVMNATLSGDTFKTVVHGINMSHLDAMCHSTYKGLEYGGLSPKDVNTTAGCNRLNVMTYKNGIVTRGVLIDIPRLRGVPYLEPGDQIFVKDIEAWEKKAGVKLGSGDALILRTGRWARRARVGPWNLNASSAGFHPSVIPWLRARDIAVIGTDAVADIVPSPIKGVGTPIHTAVLTGLGIPLLDNQDPEALAETAARLKRWDFMLVVAPLLVEGGTGSPANTIAMF